MKYGFGVDLGGTTVKLAYFDETGKMLDKWEIPTDISDNGSHILPDIAAALLGYISEKGIEKEQLLGVGIGVPGPVSDDGVVNRCSNLFWGVFNVNDTLSKLTGLKVKAGNDATVAALGECWKGGGQGSENMVMVTLGTGVGGGIVANGKILLGAHGAAGEIGHMVLNRAETEPCNCGKYGCVEQYCSATGIVRIARQQLSQSDAPSVLRERENLTCKDIFDAAGAGDSLSQQILETVYDYLGEFLGSLCSVLNPSRVVLGGGVSKAGAPLLEGIGRHFPKYVFHACQEAEFTLAELGNDAGAYGAFKLVLDSQGT